MPKERINNLKKQRNNIKDIKFFCNSYDKLNKNIKNALIYCDIPYKNTKKYNKNDFDYNKFYKWCEFMGKNNIVYISEFDFHSNISEIVWEKERINSINNADKRSSCIERLFKIVLNKEE